MDKFMEVGVVMLMAAAIFMFGRYTTEVTIDMYDIHDLSVACQENGGLHSVTGGITVAGKGSEVLGGQCLDEARFIYPIKGGRYIDFYGMDIPVEVPE
tara:strand:- start:6216 stop:6509 length:294 start_codon:yes stop_codon:yes gene_type:complete